MVQKAKDINQFNRRDFLAGLLGISTVASAGSILTLPKYRNTLFDRISLFNDATQGWIYSPTRLAQTYQIADITNNFPFNGFYPEAYAPHVNADQWKLHITGLVKQPLSFSLEELKEMPSEEQITRLICIEGWSAIGHWSGVSLPWLLRHVKADLDAKYVRFDCEDGYYTTIDMASALHSQTLLSFDFLNQPLSAAYGAPLRLRIPIKLGFKNAKYINSITITDNGGNGYWEDKGYNWFSGL